MSEYTTSIMDIVKSFSNTGNILNDIKIASPKIFDFEYPIWDENHRTELQEKIIKRYINREIGLETYGLWKLYLNEKMNLIMPYYNDLASSVNLKYDILTDINLTTDSTDIINKDETRNIEREVTAENNKNFTNNENSSNNKDIKNISEINRTETNSGNGKTTETNTGNQLTSDLPQYNAAGIDYGTSNVNVNNTITSSFENSETKQITDTKTDTNSENEEIKSQNDGNEIVNEHRKDNDSDKFTTDNVISHNETVTGKTGGKTYGELVQDYRKTLINIDNMIIDSLSDLFMNIY